MTDVGRNDPCPCGSGEKYKKCCWSPGPGGSPGRRVSTHVTPEVRREASGVRAWQADLVPMSARFRDDPAARPAAVVVTAGRPVLASEVVVRAPGEPEEVAGLLAAALRSAADAMDGWPARVEVRHQEVTPHVREALGAEGPEVVARRRLPAVEEVGRGLARDVFGDPRRPVVARPETWAAWGLPDPVVAELFEAAATFWRAAPWTWLENHRALTVRPPDGRTWTAGVLGAGGQEHGLNLYADPDDLGEMLRPGAAGDVLDRIESRVLSLTFDPRGELPRPMQREVASRGWEVAAPEAYPKLTTILTPGGGVSRRAAGELTSALRAVAALAERSGEALARGEAVAWRHPDTGVELAAEEEPETGGWGPWERPTELAPSGPEGAGARPAAAAGAAAPGGVGLPWPEHGTGGDDREGHVDVLDAETDRFAGWLLDERRLSEATARKHGTNAAAFLEFLFGWEGVPMEAVTEYDLRSFLFDWYPRKTWDAEYRVEAMPVSLGHLFGWMAEERGIRCPWAEVVLEERSAYRIRWNSCPGGPWWDEATGRWRADLLDDLEGRVLLHDPGLGRTAEWGVEGPLGATMGPLEAALERELQRRWLVWRDEEIRDGRTRPPPLRAALVRRQRDWEQAPHPGLDGATPLEAIRRERAEEG